MWWCVDAGGAVSLGCYSHQVLQCTPLPHDHAPASLSWCCTHATLAWHVVTRLQQLATAVRWDERHIRTLLCVCMWCACVRQQVLSCVLVQRLSCMCACARVCVVVALPGGVMFECCQGFKSPGALVYICWLSVRAAVLRYHRGCLLPAAAVLSISPAPLQVSFGIWPCCSLMWFAGRPALWGYQASACVLYVCPSVSLSLPPGRSLHFMDVSQHSRHLPTVPHLTALPFHAAGQHAATGSVKA